MVVSDQTSPRYAPLFAGFELFNILLGGEQPALRTFYYRLLRLTSLAIQPLFVFDGPNKPKFKRNKQTGPNVCTIPEFLAKQLLKEFGLPYHVAPGEAEAECALLQREGIVDAVLSEDVDTIMFGSGVTIRNWSAEGKGKVPTHVNVYDSAKIKSGQAGLDREGMVLIAMMSGGDYIPEGIPGCGPKTACEAARAGFGAKLCKIEKGDKKAFDEWKTELAHELRSNESKFFRVKHGSLQIPESFPNREILRYYTHPSLSSLETVRDLERNIVWEKPMDLPALRKFTEEAFKWETVIGAKKFIRTLAPGLLVRELRLRSESQKSGLIQKIHQARQHASTDNTPELRISYVPIDVVNIDLSIERPEDGDLEDGEDEEANGEDNDIPSSTQQRPYLFDPTEMAKLWIFNHFVELGAKQQYEEWTKLQGAKAAKAVTLAARKPRAPAQKKGIDGTMPAGAIHQFAKVTKSMPQVATKTHIAVDARQELPFPDLPASSYSNRLHEPFRNSKAPPRTTSAREIIDLASSSSPVSLPKKTQSITTSTSHAEGNVSAHVTTRRTAPLQRALTEGCNPFSVETMDLTAETSIVPTRRAPLSRAKAPSKRKAHANSPIGTPKATKKSSVSTLSPIRITSSPMRQEPITQYFSPSRTRQVDALDLTNSSPSRSSRVNIFHAPSIVKKDSLSQELTGYSIFQAPVNSEIRTSAKVTSTFIHAIDLTSPMPHRSQSTVTSTFAVSKNCASPTTSKPAAVARGRLETCDGNRQRVRVRESLRGAFAIEEENSKAIERSRPSKSKSTWNLHDVSVMDLTGNS
jgi:Holliday junction resolvase YEN1